jgi:hypothetical protein
MVLEEDVSILLNQLSVAMITDLKLLRTIPVLMSVKFSESRGPQAGSIAKFSGHETLTRAGKSTANVQRASERARQSTRGNI